ncbi:hypothetical protein FRX31_028903 [Thalictrum thalictroides]|uniref:Uncharacterized protein n=1 Tax=Thalictrum thalictroides TaxID=46969 RepID=A0A7J6V904_THATH|nr:hypothetical protein FRX31_028903 [Thalictrum thalictroides]
MSKQRTSRRAACRNSMEGCSICRFMEKGGTKVGGWPRNVNYIHRTESDEVTSGNENTQMNNK